MSTDSIVVFIIGAVVVAVSRIFTFWLKRNPKLAANSTLQFVGRMLAGLSQAAEVAPTGFTQHIVSGVANAAEKAAEEAISDEAAKPAITSAPDPKKPETPNFGTGGV